MSEPTRTVIVGPVEFRIAEPWKDIRVKADIGMSGVGLTLWLLVSGVYSVLFVVDSASKRIADAIDRNTAAETCVTVEEVTE